MGNQLVPLRAAAVATLLGLGLSWPLNPIVTTEFEKLSTRYTDSDRWFRLISIENVNRQAVIERIVRLELEKEPYFPPLNRDAPYYDLVQRFNADEKARAEDRRLKNILGTWLSVLNTWLVPLAVISFYSFPRSGSAVPRHVSLYRTGGLTGRIFPKGRDAQTIFQILIGDALAETVVGDLAERREKFVIVAGKRRATHWYYSQVLRSIAPFAWAAFKRVSGLMAAADAWRRFRG